MLILAYVAAYGLAGVAVLAPCLMLALAIFLLTERAWLGAGLVTIGGLPLSVLPAVLLLNAIS